ncbi:glycosyltransferase [Cronobacter sp. JZ38]|uniref:glycosyltransferase family 2 protein n=1 Tax=Cronobacter sp. JZ38 TaxID=1906275 RepID=UPI00155796F4|nr:glycosyltransferase [Cronobacter sp. JZ38]
MNLPTISIIIPCYNHSAYVKNCLESTLVAYEGVLEVIICDDASQDSSADIIRSFIKNNERGKINYIFLQNETNSGVCNTLNRCLKQAKHDYVYLIASDDYLCENGLTQAMLFLLEKNADAIISDCHVVNENNEIVAESAFFDYRKSSARQLKKNIANALVFNWVVPGPALLLKKTVYDDIGQYDPSLMAEDRDFYLRLLSSKKNVIFNSAKVACYRIHSNNLSRTSFFKENASAEFSLVNYKYYSEFNRLARIYLKTYKLDISGNIVLAFYIRKLIKMLYIFLSI